MEPALNSHAQVDKKQLPAFPSMPSKDMQASTACWGATNVWRIGCIMSCHTVTSTCLIYIPGSKHATIHRAACGACMHNMWPVDLPCHVVSSYWHPCIKAPPASFFEVWLMDNCSPLSLSIHGSSRVYEIWIYIYKSIYYIVANTVL